MFVRFREVGWHRWPDPPPARDYLGHRHRHVFHVEVWTDAPTDNARSVEFHDLLGHAEGVWLAMGCPEFGDRSCETLAAELAAGVAGIIGEQTWAQVSEDGEAGAVVLARPWPEPWPPASAAQEPPLSG